MGFYLYLLSSIAIREPDHIKILATRVHPKVAANTTVDKNPPVQAAGTTGWVGCTQNSLYSVFVFYFFIL